MRQDICRAFIEYLQTNSTQGSAAPYQATFLTLNNHHIRKHTYPSIRWIYQVNAVGHLVLSGIEGQSGREVRLRFPFPHSHSGLSRIA